MYKVIERCFSPTRPYHGNIHQTRLYNSEETFERYGKHYVGFTWGGHYHGTAYKLTSVKPNVWSRLTEDFPEG